MRHRCVGLHVVLSALLLLLTCPHLFSQSITRTQSVGAYIYNFPKHITWPDEKGYSDFSIVLISGDGEVIKEIRKISESARIKGKPINLTVAQEADEDAIAGARMIFITGDRSEHYLEVFDMVEGKPVVLVSENLIDKRFVMINLYDAPDNRLQFEINRANIINQGLSVDDEILFLGGTMIDVAELYRKSQQSLRSMQKRMEQYERRLDSLNRRFASIQSDIDRQNQKIKEQADYINRQNTDLTRQLGMVDDQKELIMTQEAMLEGQRDSLRKQISRLRSTEQLLKAQKEAVERGRDTLLWQKANIAMMNTEIKKKTSELDQMGMRFMRQRQLTILVGVVGTLIALLVILIFRAYRNIRSKSEQLRQQKIEIESINETLRLTNRELNEKNEELTLTMERLKETRNKLVTSEKMASLGVLTAGIAHELNNPINFVYAGANSLRRDFADIVPVLEEIGHISPDEGDERDIIARLRKKKAGYQFEEAYHGMLETINAIVLGAERTAEIVNGLRDFSRLDKDEHRKINIHDIIDNVLVLLKNQLRDRIGVVRKYDLSVPPVDCVPGKINQVFMNILSNAIDAIDGNGDIIITTALTGSSVLISVRDTGRGMSEEVKANIFDPFFTTKETGKGVGLGLSITYGIVKEHNGDIDVISEEGHGTEFMIRLPVSYR